MLGNGCASAVALLALVQHACRFVFCDAHKTLLVGGTKDISFMGPICEKHGRQIDAVIGRDGAAVVVRHTRNDSIKTECDYFNYSILINKCSRECNNADFFWLQQIVLRCSLE